MNTPNTTTKKKWQPSLLMKAEITNEIKAIKTYIRPENKLELNIVKDSYWLKGAFWGEPRPGHPEGKIIYHIYEVLNNVEKIKCSSIIRLQLRLITILHDTFKYLEEQTRPRTDWSKHHAVYALHFAKKHTKDQAILDVIELHDEAYYAWLKFKAGKIKASNLKLEQLIQRLGPNLQLFYLFFKCDTQTGNKYQAPIEWFEKRVKGIQIINF